MKSLLPRALLPALLALALAAPGVVHAGGTRRTVLVEFFCTQGCEWAETAAAALDRVAAEFGPSRVLAVEYNLDLDRELFERRFYLYVPPDTHVPFAFFDGSRLGIYGSNNDVEESYGWYREAAVQELTEPSPIRVESAVHLSDRSASFETRVTNTSASTIEEAELYLGLYESGGVGRTDRLLRYLSPALPLGALTPGESRTIAHQTPSLTPEADPSRVEGLAFVQQSGNNAVLQAVHADEPRLALHPPSLAAVVAVGSPATAPQPILVDGLGAPFRWSLEPPQTGWMSVTPATGERGDTFTVTLVPTGLSAGTYSGRIVVRTDAPVGPTEQEITVTMHVATQVSTSYLPLVACP